MNIRLVIIISIVGLLLLAGMASSCVHMGRLRNAHDREMATRLDLEEKMSKAAQEKARDDKKINNLSRALEEERTAHQATKKTLAEEQAANQNLKDELSKAAEVKGALEKKLEDLEAAGQKAPKTGKR